MAYDAPITEIEFCLKEIARIGDLQGLPGLGAYDEDILRPVLEEAAKLARDVLAPLNQTGDSQGARLEDGGVIAADGFKAAYDAFRAGGWMGLAAPESWGGQGLPRAMALGVMEVVHAANLAFTLCPMLSFGAIEALLAPGTDDQKQM